MTVTCMKLNTFTSQSDGRRAMSHRVVLDEPPFFTTPRRTTNEDVIQNQAMPTVSHAVPWMYYPHDDSLSQNKRGNILTNIKAKKILNKTNEAILKNKDGSKIKTEANNEFVDEFQKKLDKEIFEERDSRYVNESNESFEKVSNKTVDDRPFIAKSRSIHEVNEKSKERCSRNDTVLTTESLKKCSKELNKDSTNHIRERQREKIKKPKWRLSSGVLITLVILNVTGRGVAVEVISSNTLATLLGYEGSCWLGAEERPCTLALACWLQGGTRVRGCGGWLFACCQLPSKTPYTNHNNVASPDWQYKVSPPRLRQVPQRNVMPNNVFRRRVDDDVTQTDCGVPSSRILQKRIIGGREARFAEFPWQAHVRISEFQCGGVLVSQWYVATAAHCVSRAHVRDIVVWLGALDTSAGSRTARKVGSRDIEYSWWRCQERPPSWQRHRGAPLGKRY